MRMYYLTTSVTILNNFFGEASCLGEHTAAEPEKKIVFQKKLCKARRGIGAPVNKLSISALKATPCSPRQDASGNLLPNCLVNTYENKAFC